MHIFSVDFFCVAIFYCMPRPPTIFHLQNIKVNDNGVVPAGHRSKVKVIGICSAVKKMSRSMTKQAL